MGNKPSMSEKRRTTLYSASTFTGISPLARISEEGFLPMTPAVKKKLLAGKRFKHVRLSVLTRGEERKQTEGGSDVNQSERVEKEGGLERMRKETGRDDALAESAEAGEAQKEEKVEQETTNQSVKQGPSAGSQSKSLNALSLKMEQEHLPFMKSPKATNRRYSLMDASLCDAKSRYAISLRDRLRQSKLELGFSDEYLNWKEFSFSVNPEGGRRPTVERRSTLRPGERSTSSGHVDVCAHNCQILGLCGLGRSRTALARPNDVHKPDDVVGAERPHEPREDCDCDTCTLAYLTDMSWVLPEPEGFAEDELRARYAAGMRDRADVRDLHGRPHDLVELKVSRRSRSHLGASVASPSSTSSSFEPDSTNLKIRSLFQQYHAGKNPREEYDVSTSTSPAKSPRSRAGSDGGGGLRTKREDTHGRASRKSKAASARTSSSGLASAASSLSTIMSFRRVKQMFQSITERNRPRKRARRNLHEFREMEGLGLGEVRRHRWYPSDSKARAIWQDISGSMPVQAEFRGARPRRTAEPKRST